MNAISFLIAEHQKFRNQFTEINNLADDARKKECFERLCLELSIHEKMEQTEWYPELSGYGELKEIIAHLITEEKNAANLIKEFSKLKTKAEWQDKFTKLKNDVEHHAHEEETKLFPKVKKLLSEDKLEKLGHAMRQYKEGQFRQAA